jgi:hypothetical protein
VVTALAVPTAARAQAASALAWPSQVISVNPLGLVFDYYYVEYERALSSSSTGALSGSYWDADKYRYVSVDARYRLYPSERAPQGFSISATLGLSRVTNTEYDCGNVIKEIGCDPIPGFRETTGNALTTGLQLDYAWLLGAHKRVALGLGVGAKRLHYLQDRPGRAPRTQPTLRFTIGRAF